MKRRSTQNEKKIKSNTVVIPYTKKDWEVGQNVNLSVLCPFKWLIFSSKIEFCNEEIVRDKEYWRAISV